MRAGSFSVCTVGLTARASNLILSKMPCSLTPKTRLSIKIGASVLKGALSTMYHVTLCSLMKKKKKKEQEYSLGWRMVHIFRSTCKDEEMQRCTYTRESQIRRTSMCTNGGVSKLSGRGDDQDKRQR